MDIIVDTQVLSYRFKQGVADAECGQAICSITANEFLLAQSRDSSRPDYYTIHPVVLSHVVGEAVPFDRDHFRNPKWARLGARRTDQLVIDFIREFPAYKEYGNEAITEIINHKIFELYRISIQHLSKEKQKYLLKRMRYIMENSYTCYPVTEDALETGIDLFQKFTSKYNPKENIRNTINDVLILSTAVAHKKTLLTHDNLLNRFAADALGGTVLSESQNILIDFDKPEIVTTKMSRESKGYINRGWSFYLRKIG